MVQREVPRAPSAQCPMSTTTQPAKRKLCGPLSGRLELGVLQSQPLHAGVAEIHLDPCVTAAAFRVDDDSQAEFGVLHALSDAPARPRRVAARRIPILVVVLCGDASV